MTSANRPAGLNRTLLTLTGLVLIAGGGFAVATHFGKLKVLDRAAPLVPGDAVPPTWVFYVAIAAAVIIGLLCVRWLAAQAFRKPKSSTWRLEERPETGTTQLASSTAAEPVAAEIGEYHGVRSASATLAGPARSPELFLRIAAEQGADINELRRQIDAEAIPRLRQALDLDTLPVSIEFRFTSQAVARTL
ncbi:alkaline shock response membrane anchor protein AmaP [Amycolatopsis sp. H20-H5]|uniref:alkaline shock response membrane anchor protein AmaP n=1 Tax=Amycolatopsis sp. H20-H5 TaxID=3046309 RepID=UPI002DB814D9|nr:alkaline shock response membrane anchor protein AmaP [Amycolatopsis sp. H20-H5]MEC3975645.1 alkaline shock response membrane anchor protein AmaP [Amycolatopsis sp. H20-H5]